MSLALGLSALLLSSSVFLVALAHVAPRLIDLWERVVALVWPREPMSRGIDGRMRTDRENEAFEESLFFADDRQFVSYDTAVTPPRMHA